VWLRQLYTDIATTNSLLDPTIIHVDNQSAIAIANNTKSNKRTKHIDIRYHYIREAIANNAIVTKYCPSNQMLADILTKGLPRDKFTPLRNMLGPIA
jgi:hypothetical protein